MNKKLILFFFISIFLISNVYALGLTPARTTLNFEPNLKKTIGFSVINSEKADLNLEVYTKGELASYITLERNSLTLSSGEEKRDISYSFTLPDKLSPGLHTAEVVISQPADNTGGDSYIGATLAVATQLHIRVPYPGKYAEADVNVINRDGETLLIIPVSNLGEFDLISVKANIEIYNSTGEKINSFNTEPISINSKEKKEVIGRINPALEGSYKAVITIIYDGETLVIEKFFSSFDSALELQQVSVDDFRLGAIAKFEMLIENKDNKDLPNVYSQTNIFNTNGELMADFKSQNYDVSASSKKLLVSYWDTKGVKEGSYNSKIFLKYEDKSIEKQLKFEVSSDEIRVIGLGYVISQKSGGDSSNLILILVGVIILLVLLNVSWFFFFRNKLNKNK